MILRPFLYEETACASFLFGCLTERKLAVVDPHEALVDAYLDAAEFGAALLEDAPPPPADQAAIVAANRSG